MTRYAILAGVSEKPGFQQKSLLNFYRFLISTRGGFWAEREILIMPEGIDLALLRLVLRRLSEDGTDCILLYFCGNEGDVRTRDGFKVGGTEIKLSFIEEMCSHQITVFDACRSLVSDAEWDDALENKGIADLPVISGGNYCVKGGVFLAGCGTGERPILSADGSGVYTSALLEALETTEELQDITGADRIARFACAVAQEIENHTATTADLKKIGGVSREIKTVRWRKSKSVRI